MLPFDWFICATCSHYHREWYNAGVTIFPVHIRALPIISHSVSELLGKVTYPIPIQGTVSIRVIGPDTTSE